MDWRTECLEQVNRGMSKMEVTLMYVKRDKVVKQIKWYPLKRELWVEVGSGEKGMGDYRMFGPFTTPEEVVDQFVKTGWTE